MADPSMLPDMGDLAKVGGGGAAASLLTLIAGRLFGSQDKVLARLELLQSQVQDMSTKLAVLVAASERRDSDFARLTNQVDEHSKQLARLEAVVSKFSEGT